MKTCDYGGSSESRYSRTVSVIRYSAVEMLDLESDDFGHWLPGPVLLCHGSAGQF